MPSIKYSAGDDEVDCTVDVSVDGLNFSIWENLKFTWSQLKLTSKVMRQSSISSCECDQRQDVIFIATGQSAY